MEIVVVGSVALDTIRTPRTVRAGLLGGSAAHFSLAAVHFAPVGVVAVVGDDFPDAHAAVLRSRGIDLTGLERRSGATFSWEGEYLADMKVRRSLRTEVGVFSEFRPMLPASYRNPRALFLANIDPDLQQDVLAQLPDAPLVAVDTMNFWIESKPESVRRVISRANILLVNDEEAELLTGSADMAVAAQKIRALGPDVVVVKKGPHGAAALGDWGWLLFPAVPVTAVNDPTGAGDAFAGGLVGYLATREWRDRDRFAEALAMGTAVASLVVEEFGVEALARERKGDLGQRCRLLQEAMRFTAPQRFAP